MISKIKKLALETGKSDKILKQIEESSELSIALVNDDTANIKEEIADNFLVLFQIMVLWDFTEEEIEEIIEYKLERSLTRLQKGVLNER